MIESAKRSPKVAKGSNLQLVGDFFASGMDTERLTELGAKPLTSLYEKVDAIDSPITLARELAELQMMTNDKPLIAFGPETDTRDRNRYLLYLFGVDLVMASRDNYLKKEAEPIRAAYLAYIEETLSLMGAPIEDAKARAKSILDIEKRIASKKLTPVEKMDPGKRFVRMSMNEVEALLSNIDIKTYLKTLGLPLQEEFIVVEKNSLRILRAHSANAWCAMAGFRKKRRKRHWKKPKNWSNRLTLTRCCPESNSTVSSQ